MAVEDMRAQNEASKVTTHYAFQVPDDTPTDTLHFKSDDAITLELVKELTGIELAVIKCGISIFDLGLHDATVARIIDSEGNLNVVHLFINKVYDV